MNLQATSRRRMVADRLAAAIVTTGGLTIIASILCILGFILIEVWPLTRGARVSAGKTHDVNGEILAIVGDEHRTHAAMLAADGQLVIQDLSSGAIVQRVALLAEGDAPVPLTSAASGTRGLFLAGVTRDGRIAARSVSFRVEFVGDERRVAPVVSDPIVFEMNTDGAPVPGPFALQVSEDGSATAAAIDSRGVLVLVHRVTRTNMLTGDVTESWARQERDAPPGVLSLILDGERSNLFAGTSDGEIAWWTVGGGDVSPAATVSSTSRVTAMTLLIGDRSLVAGHDDGSVAIWTGVRGVDNRFTLERIHEFAPTGRAIRRLTPSMRHKGFVALDDQDRLTLYHSTSERVLWTGPSPIPATMAVHFTPKADGLLLGSDGRSAMLDVDSPHPEVGLRALFGKVWYEGYEKPEYVWQSTGGTDDFEPKLSLVPLLIGTFKGTIYSLLLAIPLGVLGAMYTSQFMDPALRRYVKPTVEIMAALPSVVLGFLAGLWLAPRIEAIIPALAMMTTGLPVAIVLGGLAWSRLPSAIRHRLLPGSEVFFYMGVSAATILACLWLNDAVERLLFDGSFQAWLLEGTGLPYDQRNAVVVGLAMGFAVIPIIFSVAEDAFSNVPRSLVSGSLALGATRWQTVTRVVFPTASPGIFSATMIGFGRAVGETMIVLMATGNTPIMDWNVFNGFRTLSANIAVEIPEAPQGGTLYRTLFLGALLLFLLTFAVNTMAELVRQRLRRRYGNL